MAPFQFSPAGPGRRRQRRRILDGLVAGHPPDRILAGLTNHVQAKLEPLAQALAAALDPLALINPVEAGRVPPRDVDRDFGPSR